MKCNCGGALLRLSGGFGEPEEFICDKCEKVWFACEVCDGNLHSRTNGVLEYSEHYIDIFSRKEG